MRGWLEYIFDTIKQVIDQIPMSLIIRVIVSTLIALISLGVLAKNTDIKSLDTKGVLSLLISVASIIVAIIVTYIFSKLFAEKSERIQRKFEIDKWATKITDLRKMAYHIKGMHDFWSYASTKAMLDSKYKKINFESLRDDTIKYEDLLKIFEEIGGEISGQGYLALKGLQDKDHPFSFYQEFTPKNYSVEENERFKSYTNAFWYFLDKSDNSIVNFDRVNSHSKSLVDKLFHKIMGRQINQSDYKNEIKALFAYFDCEAFEIHRYLVVLNTRAYPPLFISSLINMVMFVLILIISFITFVSNFSPFLNYWMTILLSVSFIAVTTDLISIIIFGLRRELRVNEFYHI